MNPTQNRDFVVGGAFFATRRLKVAGRTFDPGQELDADAVAALGSDTLRTLWTNSQVTQVRPNKDAVRTADFTPYDLDAEIAARKEQAAVLDAASVEATTAPGTSAADVRRIVEADAPALPTERSRDEQAAEAAASLDVGRELFRPETSTTTPAGTKSMDTKSDGDVTAAETPSGKAKAKK